MTTPQRIRALLSESPEVLLWAALFIIVLYI
jgi:hypothetical protein